MNPFRFLPPLFLSAASVASAGTLAHFRTILGDLEVELYDQDKPVTVQNFIRYTQRGLYQATLIHRWAPGFVIQGGGFAAADLTNINAVFPLVTGFGTITNEFSLGRPVFQRLWHDCHGPRGRKDQFGNLAVVHQPYQQR